MSKKLIFAFALSMMLASGAFVNAGAANLSGPYFSKPACWSFACGLNTAHPAAQVTPSQMGSVGF